jgi:cbb3-type cytochrome oxidase maturation protein
LLSNLKIEDMSVIYLLIGISLLAALGFLAAFLWSIKTGQYEDDYTPGVRILFDDIKEKKTKNK